MEGYFFKPKDANDFRVKLIAMLKDQQKMVKRMSNKIGRMASPPETVTAEC